MPTIPEPSHAPDGPTAEKAIAQFLDGLGFDPADTALESTARKVSSVFRDTLLAGYDKDVADILAGTYEGNFRDFVMIRRIPFVSLCPHHLLPFHGHASVGYVPSGRVVGLSRLGDLVNALSRRFQFQEALTQQIVDALMTHLEPEAAACRLVATQLCESAVREMKTDTEVITEAFRGAFEVDGDLRRDLWTSEITNP